MKVVFGVLNGKSKNKYINCKKSVWVFNNV